MYPWGADRYYLAPCPSLRDHYEILDRHAVNGYDEPWVEVPGLPYAEALAQCQHLNATWESQLPPCTCPPKEDEPRMPLTMHEIRTAYPNPVKNHESWNVNCYCVGGSLCLYTAADRNDPSPIRFPMEAYLGHVLHVVNPCLDQNLANWYGRRIVATNDTGDFEWAWNLLASALNFRGQETTTWP